MWLFEIFKLKKAVDETKKLAKTISPEELAGPKWGPGNPEDEKKRSHVTVFVRLQDGALTMKRRFLVPSTSSLDESKDRFLAEFAITTPPRIVRFRDEHGYVLSRELMAMPLYWLSNRGCLNVQIEGQTVWQQVQTNSQTAWQRVTRSIPWTSKL